MSSADDPTPVITAELGKLFPSQALSFCATSLPESFALFPAEAEHTSGMVERRLREYTQGRYCARSAMHLLGLAPAPVIKGANREPRWPQGVVGSISHTGDVAAAVVGPAWALESVGLDMESAEPLTTDIVAMICLPQENPDSDGELGKLLFSIKESIYKCIFPLVGEYVDFLEMEVRLSEDGQHYSAISHSEKCPTAITERLEGRYVRLPNLVISGAWIKSSGKKQG